MTTPTPHEEDHHHDEVYSKTVFGFWIYLLTDFVLFGVLFACYVVLRNNVFGGPPLSMLISLPTTLVQTLVLLLSAFTAGIGGAAAHRKQKGTTILFFIITFILGLIFAWIEVAEFMRLHASGNGWDRSAFTSSFFTLVGTHLAHVFFALLWIILLLIPVIKEGISHVSLLRLSCLRMFWQFINVVWVFIFTIVYLLGA